MNVVVLDASAIAKWFVREKGSSDMRLIRDRIASGKLTGYAPDLVLIEIANLLRYSRGASPEDALNAVRSLSILLRLKRDEKLLEKAVRLAFKKSITVYDSLYVALAMEMGTRLVTYDGELLNKFEGVAITAEELLRQMESDKIGPSRERAP